MNFNFDWIMKNSYFHIEKMNYSGMAFALCDLAHTGQTPMATSRQCAGMPESSLRHHAKSMAQV
jgi:hypothetical protein